jgi:hypothetical protein
MHGQRRDILDRGNEQMPRLLFKIENFLSDVCRLAVLAGLAGTNQS